MNTLNRLDFIDFGKGFAIISIVLFHYFLPYASGFMVKALMLGGAGVHVFFLLSGFGLSLSTQSSSASAFYLRRFKTLLIPYFIVVLFTFAINPTTGYFPNDGLYALGGHLFFYKMFDESIIGSFGYPFWFISTIIQFYLVYPLLRSAMDRMGGSRFALISLLISSIFWLIVVAMELENQRIFNSFFLQYLWEFSLGMFLGKRYLNTGMAFWEQPTIRLIFTAAVFLGLMAALALKGGRWGRTFNDIPALIGYLALCILVFQLGKNRLAFIRRALTKIGSYSYEVYLLHILILLIVTNLIRNLETQFPQAIVTPTLSLICTLALSIIFHALNKKIISYTLVSRQKPNPPKIKANT